MEKIISEIEAFCSAKGMAESQFGLLALNDKNFVPQLRAGRDLRFSTVERIRNFMAQDAAA